MYYLEENSQRIGVLRDLNANEITHQNWLIFFSEVKGNTKITHVTQLTTRVLEDTICAHIFWYIGISDRSKNCAGCDDRTVPYLN